MITLATRHGHKVDIWTYNIITLDVCIYKKLFNQNFTLNRWCKCAHLIIFRSSGIFFAGHLVCLALQLLGDKSLVSEELVSYPRLH